MRWPAEFDVGGRGAGELDDGGDPAEDLLGRGLRDPGGVGGEDRRLVGVFEEGLDAAGDGVSGGLVAAADEELDVAVEALVVERSAVDGGVGKEGDDVELVVADRPGAGRVDERPGGRRGTPGRPGGARRRRSHRAGRRDG